MRDGNDENLFAANAIHNHEWKTSTDEAACCMAIPPRNVGRSVDTLDREVDLAQELLGNARTTRAIPAKGCVELLRAAG